jgi:hypothetical protein
LEDFAVSSAHLAAPLTHQAFPMARSPVGLSLDGVEYLELICFHVSPGALERQLLEHAYAAFTRFVTYLHFPSQMRLICYLPYLMIMQRFN